MGNHLVTIKPQSPDTAYAQCACGIGFAIQQTAELEGYIIQHFTKVGLIKWEH